MKNTTHGLYVAWLINVTTLQACYNHFSLVIQEMHLERTAMSRKLVMFTRLPKTIELLSCDVFPGPSAQKDR
jgi:hypothetical protein